VSVSDDLASRALRVITGYLELGNEAFDAAGARFVRCRETPRRYDSNHVATVRCDTPEAIDALLARADVEFVDYAYRRFDTDPWTPPSFTARLALDGYSRTDELWLVLDGDLRAQAAEFEIRQVQDENGWAAVAEMQRLDWREASERLRREQDDSLVPEFVLAKRRKVPPVRYWIACVDSSPVAYFSSWEGLDGVGMVEDLFTHPDFRRRGIATALIAQCVADVRGRGAASVIIGADPTDTPKAMYAAMGFRPLLVTSNWLKRLDGRPM
jgi:GNAT superfamily N-acetyltransferase